MRNPFTSYSQIKDVSIFIAYNDITDCLVPVSIKKRKKSLNYNTRFSFY